MSPTTLWALIKAGPLSATVTRDGGVPYRVQVIAVSRTTAGTALRTVRADGRHERHIQGSSIRYVRSIRSTWTVTIDTPEEGEQS